MENFGHRFIAHIVNWGIPAGIGAIFGATFKWFYASRTEWLESRREKAERKVDSRVLEAIGNRTPWKGPRPQTGAGMWAVKSDEIAKILKINQDAVADSLERLGRAGKVRRDKGTLSDPAPWWFLTPR